jgi:hypothetical protein
MMALTRLLRTMITREMSSDVWLASVSQDTGSLSDYLGQRPPYHEWIADRLSPRIGRKMSDRLYYHSALSIRRTRY